MKRHIKLRGEFDSKSGKVTVTVLEQSHISEEFTGLNYRTPFSKVSQYGQAFYHNGVILKSATCPQFCGCGEANTSFGYQCSYLLFVRGTDRTSYNNRIKIPIEAWKAIKEAVKSYNEYFDEKE